MVQSLLHAAAAEMVALLHTALHADVLYVAREHARPAENRPDGFSSAPENSVYFNDTKSSDFSVEAKAA